MIIPYKIGITPQRIDTLAKDLGLPPQTIDTLKSYTYIQLDLQVADDGRITGGHVVDAACNSEPAKPASPAKPITIDTVIAAYIETRDKMAEMKKEFEKSVEALKGLQDKRAAWLQKQMDTLGVESLKAASGTCFADWKDSATVADWQAFFTWVMAEGEYEFLQHAVSKAAVKQRLEDDQPPPPGINYTRFKDIKVRRK